MRLSWARFSARFSWAGFCLLAGAVLTAGAAHADIKVGVVVSASGPGSALGGPQMRGCRITIMLVNTIG